ncbi:type II toxin-antitoxin system VapC family toxin, partial [Mycobacterium kansasii]
DPSQVASSALTVLSSAETNLWVSAASAWEISIKTRLGRLDGEALLSAWSDIVADMSTSELPIESPDAILAGRLPWEHKD